MNSKELELDIKKKLSEHRQLFTIFYCLVNDKIDKLVELKDQEAVVREIAIAERYERQIYWLIAAVKELANYLEEDIRGVESIKELLSEYPDF